MLFEDNYLEAECQGSLGLKSSEERHFAALLVSTVTGDPGRRHISPGGDHVLLAWVAEGAGATQQGTKCCLVEMVPLSGEKTYLDNGKKLYSAGVESAVNHLHSD